MSLSADELRAVAADARTHLRGAVVQKAFSPFPALAFLELRIPGRSLWLCASAEQEVGRLSLATNRLPNPGEPSPLQRWLRQELIGHPLTDARAEDRVLLVRFGAEDEGRVLLLDLEGGGRLSVLTDRGRLFGSSSISSKRGPAPGSHDPRVEAMLTRPADVESDAVSVDAGRLKDAPADVMGARLIAAEQLFADTGRKRRAETIRRLLERPHKARLARQEKTLAKIRREAERGAEVERHRRLGELLTHNLHALPRGKATVTLTHYGEEGVEEVEVELDGKRSPRELADWHFHQYRRLQRGMGHAQHRLAEMEREAAHSRTALEQLRGMSDADLLAQHEVLARPPTLPGQAPASPYRAHVSGAGLPIWVGKGGKANQQLTFGVARPHHLWLHARGVSGAHVVIALAKGQVVDQESLLDAAHLALHHSDLKGQPEGEVSWMPRKYVRAVKGGAPGKVTYTQEKTFLVRVEPERLQRLLGG